MHKKAMHHMERIAHHLMKLHDHHQGMKSRIDEHLGASHKGPHKQALKSRRHESAAMEHKAGHHAGYAIKSTRKGK